MGEAGDVGADLETEAVRVRGAQSVVQS